MGLIVPDSTAAPVEMATVKEDKLTDEANAFQSQAHLQPYWRTYWSRSR